MRTYAARAARPKGERTSSLARWDGGGGRESERERLRLSISPAVLLLYTHAGRPTLVRRAAARESGKRRVTNARMGYRQFIFSFSSSFFLSLSLGLSHLYRASFSLLGYWLFISFRSSFHPAERFFSSAPRGAAAAAAVGLCFRILVRGDVCTAWLRRVCSVFFVESHVYARVSFARGGGGSPEAWE